MDERDISASIEFSRMCRAGMCMARRDKLPCPFATEGMYPSTTVCWGMTAELWQKIFAEEVE